MRGRSNDTNGFRSKCGDSGTEELFRLDTFDEAHIGTRVRGQFETYDSFLHSENLGWICTADDNLKIKQSSLVCVHQILIGDRHTKSEPPGIESRAMTAARILVRNSSRETTCLPMRWPHRLVWTWSSMCIPATPALTYCLTVRATFAGPPKL